MNFKIADSKFRELLLPKDPNDDKNIIVEIRGAVGGDELGKAQAPRTPVAAHLADDELALGLSLGHSLVNLL